jgi:hypothetical protein
MIKLIAFDPIDYWIILENKNGISLLKPPYSSINDKESISQDKLQEAISKRGFLPESKIFANEDDAITFIKTKKNQSETAVYSNTNESDEIYSFIPERPLFQIVEKYELKVLELPVSQLENLKEITEIILFRNPFIKKNQTLKAQFLKLNETCKNQIAFITTAKANKFKDLSKNEDVGGKLSSISQFLSGNKKLLRLANQ